MSGLVIFLPFEGTPLDAGQQNGAQRTCAKARGSQLITGPMQNKWTTFPGKANIYRACSPSQASELTLDIVPISAETGLNVDTIAAIVRKHLPERLITSRKITSPIAHSVFMALEIIVKN